MRYIIQDGDRYVSFHPRSESGLECDFYGQTTDVQKAHDFQLASKAEAWRAKNAPRARIHEVNDDWSWPIDESA